MNQNYTPSDHVLQYKQWNDKKAYKSYDRCHLVNNLTSALLEMRFEHYLMLEYASFWIHTKNIPCNLLCNANQTKPPHHMTRDYANLKVLSLSIIYKVQMYINWNESWIFQETPFKFCHITYQSSGIEIRDTLYKNLCYASFSHFVT